MGAQLQDAADIRVAIHMGAAVLARRPIVVRVAGALTCAVAVVIALAIVVAGRVLAARAVLLTEPGNGVAHQCIGEARRANNPEKRHTPHDTVSQFAPSMSNPCICHVWQGQNRPQRKENLFQYASLKYVAPVVFSLNSSKFPGMIVLIF